MEPGQAIRVQFGKMTIGGYIESISPMRIRERAFWIIARVAIVDGAAFLVNCRQMCYENETKAISDEELCLMMLSATRGFSDDTSLHRL